MFIHPEILYLIGGTSRCTFLVVFLTTVICQPEARCLRHWLTSLATSAAGCFSCHKVRPIRLPLFLSH